jgi:hypothetical protein
MATIANAIYYLNSTAEYTYKDEDYSTIEWIKIDGNIPTIEEIEAAKVAFDKQETTKAADLNKKKADILDRLGITAEEARLLLS